MKKAPRETQTLCTGCSKAKPKIFSPPQTPLSGGAGRPNVISWRWSLPSPTDPVWWRWMHAILSYHGNRPTNKHTDRQDRLQYTVLLSLAHSVTSIYLVSRAACGRIGIAVSAVENWLVSVASSRMSSYSLVACVGCDHRVTSLRYT